MAISKLEFHNIISERSPGNFRWPRLPFRFAGCTFRNDASVVIGRVWCRSPPSHCRLWLLSAWPTQKHFLLSMDRHWFSCQRKKRHRWTEATTVSIVT